MPTKPKSPKSTPRTHRKPEVQNRKSKFQIPRSQGPKSKIQSRKSYTSPERLEQIFAALDKLFPQAECALRHENAFQLLVATILSAQCTDERVNKVTPEVFRKYPTPKDFVALPQEDLEQA